MHDLISGGILRLFPSNHFEVSTDSWKDPHWSIVPQNDFEVSRKPYAQQWEAGVTHSKLGTSKFWRAGDQWLKHRSKMIQDDPRRDPWKKKRPFATLVREFRVILICFRKQRWQQCTMKLLLFHSFQYDPNMSGALLWFFWDRSVPICRSELSPFVVQPWRVSKAFACWGHGIPVKGLCCV